MTFIFPAFLFGLLSLTIPIIIHLFSFKKVKKIKFSNTQFLKDIKQATASRRNIKHYLVLACRLLFLFFLVLAFAQPVIDSNKKQDQSTIGLVFYIDNSMSMINQVETDLSALDYAIKLAEEIANKYPLGTQFQLITNDFTAAQFRTLNKSVFLDKLSSIKYSSNTQTGVAIANRIQNIIDQGSLHNHEVFWLSDFQKSTLVNLNDIQYDTLAKYNIIPLSFPTTKNIYIDSVYLTSPHLVNYQENSIHVILKNAGEKSVKELPVNLIVNDLQIGNIRTTINAKSRKEIIFPLNAKLNKYNKAQIEIEDFPVNFDNQFFFSLNLERKPSIVQIYQDKVNESVQQVFGNNKIFRNERFSVKNIDYTAVAKADLLILSSLEAIPVALKRVILKRISNNTGLHLWIPNYKSALEAYQPFLSLVNRDNQANNRLKFQTLDLKNPFFENIFEDNKDYFDLPYGSGTFDLKNYRQAVIKLENNQPFLASIGNRAQHWVITDPLEDSYTNFHKHALFVPVMYRLARLSVKADNKLYYTFKEQNFSIRIDSIENNEIFKIKNDKVELVPGQRIVGQELILEIPKNEIKPGYYSLKQQNKTINTLSFNLSAKESDLTQFEIEAIAKMTGNHDNMTLYDESNGKPIIDKLEKRFEGIPLWKYMLMFSLLFLLIEILILRFL